MSILVMMTLNLHNSCDLHATSYMYILIHVCVMDTLMLALRPIFGGNSSRETGEMCFLSFIYSINLDVA